jgi:putative protease
MFPHKRYKPSKVFLSKIWWWLPPVIWPDEEAELKHLIDIAIKKGGKNFVLNSPWQVAFFTNPENMNLWAGPFCNIANTMAVSVLLNLGFSGAIVSPELDGHDFMQMPENSPLPLGIVVSANWPLSISRILSGRFKTDTLFSSPKKEQGWVKKYGNNFWVYPDWKLDISSKKEELKKAGYRMFVHITEPIPANISMKKRPGMWNWNLKLK